MRSNNLRAALAFAKRGIPIFPCVPRGKKPINKHGCLGATSDPAVIRDWWLREPNANLAVATGARAGIFVLDVDGNEGESSLRHLVSTYGDLPNTVEYTTGGGGRHIWFRLPEGPAEIRNSVSRLGAHLDVRGEGGSAIVPPSIHGSGRRYRWSPTSAHAIAEPPDWLIALVRKPKVVAQRSTILPPSNIERYVAAAVVNEFQQLEEAVKGTRNDALNKTAFALAQFVACGALPNDWTREQLERRAVNLGLSVIEARCTIESGFHSGLALPRILPHLGLEMEADRHD